MFAVLVAGNRPPLIPFLYTMRVHGAYLCATQTSLTPLSWVVYKKGAFPNLSSADLGRLFNGCT